VWTKHELLLGLALTWDLDVLDRLSLVDAATVLHDSCDFVIFVWSVISGQEEKLFAFVSGHDGATIADVCNIALFTNDKDDDTTATTPLVQWLLPICILHESLLSFQTACSQCLGWVPWETLLVYDYEM